METRSILVMNWRDIRNPDAGGAEVFTHEVAKRWVRWGHEVILLTSRFQGAARGESIEGVQILRQWDRLTIYRRVLQAFLERFRGSVDIVLDQINTRPFFAPRYVDRGTRVFALIYQLAREFWSYETRFPLSVVGRYWLENRWLRAYRNVPTFTISESTRQDLKGLGFQRLHVVPVGLSATPLNQVSEKEPGPTLAYVARLKRAKLPSHALEAFRVLREQLPTARLWVIGDGYLRTRLERRAPPGVTFFGKVSDAEKLELMRRAHILLQPAVREGWGLTVLEANAMGTPAVGYDVPGLRDSIVHGETGLRVSPANPRALAHVAMGLLVNPSELMRLANNALRWSRQFDWGTSARVMLDHLFTWNS